MKNLKIRFTGFLLGLSLFAFIIFSAVTHSIIAHIPIIASLFIVNLIISFSHKALPKNKISLELREGLGLFGKSVNKVIVSFALFFAYLFGIGLVYVISRIKGKRFLKLKEKGESNWVRVKDKEVNFSEMF